MSPCIDSNKSVNVFYIRLYQSGCRTYSSHHASETMRLRVTFIQRYLVLSPSNLLPAILGFEPNVLSCCDIAHAPHCCSRSSHVMIKVEHIYLKLKYENHYSEVSMQFEWRAKV